jgi:hypothetical protein
MNNTLKMIPCPKCGKDFPELRLTKYGYNFCVNCSTTEKKVGITTVEGSGDHTYNDLIIMDASTARQIAAKEAELAGNKKALLEIIDFDNEDENAVSQSLKEGLHNTLTDEYSEEY